MSLKPRISTGVDASQVVLKAAREFADCIDARRLSQGGPFTVIAFPAQRGASSSIVDSSALAKALAKVRGTDPVVAIAHDFTAEARRTLEDMGAIAFWLQNGTWTDERWRAIRDHFKA